VQSCETRFASICDHRKWRGFAIRINECRSQLIS
jgi:hypothetical protein